MGRNRKQKKLSSQKLKAALKKYFIKNPKKRMTAGQVSKKLKTKVSKDAIHHALSILSKEGVLRSFSEGRFVLDKSYREESKKIKAPKETYTGQVDMIKSGAAYIIIPSLETDVYVPQQHLKTAVNGDEVEVIISHRRGRKPEGKVVNVVKRNTHQIMGKMVTYKKYGIVSTQSKKIDLDVFIKPENFNGAEKGDRVVVDIIDWGESQNQVIWGSVKKVVNELDEHNWTMASILVENGFDLDYPEEVLNELKKIPETISEDEIEGRKDFRDILTFTIDPDTAQDFDDAISYTELENGNHVVGVHIADVTHYLKPNTALDKEAFKRSTSVYLVDRCIAMLPEMLSNNLCSLVPNQDRLVFSAVFEFDNKYNMKSEWFGKGVIHSDKRFSYDEAQLSLDNKDGLYHKELTIVNKIAHSLRKSKFKDGAIAFESDEVKFVLDENNVPVGVKIKERKEIHMLIEDFMLLANRRVAEFVATKNKEKEVPNVYRIHDQPDIDRLADLKLMMHEYGLSLDLSTPEKISASFNMLAKKSLEDQKYKLLMQFAIRTMAKAVYSTDNIGHYGLAFEYYTHFTSPIRRYSDVLVHRILEKNLKEEYREDKATLESKCLHISKQERRAMDAERDSIKYKQVEYMGQFIGEEFTGIVSGVIEKGIFVEVSETKAEGMIPFTRIPGRFGAVDGRFKAQDSSNGNQLMLGDEVKVRIVGTDLIKRLIEMDIVE